MHTFEYSKHISFNSNIKKKKLIKISETKHLFLYINVNYIPNESMKTINNASSSIKHIILMPL